MDDALGRAKQCLDKRDFAAAKLWFREAGEQGFKAEALYGLGVVSYALGNYDEAIDHLSAALEVDPNNANAYYYLGKIALMEGKRDDAVVLFAHTLVRQPQHKGASSELAPLLQQQSAADAPPQPRSSPGRTVGARKSPSGQRASEPSGSSPVQSAEPTPPASGRWPSSVVGRAKNVQRVLENRMQVHVLRFRVEPQDESRRRSAAIAVEIRGYALYGNVEEGDWVEVPPKPKVLPSWRWQVYNLTTGELVYGKKVQIG